ncbi:MAG: uracil-DNA glycosylase [Chloroflexota bacterium]|nr:MAG: hypothetical protein DIU68_07040 [Chloroflexota bacterium]
MPDIDAFIQRLATTPTADDAYNQYGAGDNPYNALRRQNLRRFLYDFYERRPKVALIAEAPGYRGMRLSGLPMVSRRTLVEGIPALDLFGLSRGYVDVPEPGFEHIRSEQSGTIMWGTLAELGVVPLLWGAFPFHPHRPGEALTNRPPRRREVETGLPFVRDLLEMFAPERVLAVGNVAHGALASLGIDAVKIRHPAQGGKNDFVAGLRRELGPADAR